MKHAPAIFDHVQEAPAPMAAMEMFTLTEDIPGHPKNSTISRATLEAAGFFVPPICVGEKFVIKGREFVVNNLTKRGLNLRRCAV